LPTTVEEFQPVYEPPPTPVVQQPATKRSSKLIPILATAGALGLSGLLARSMYLNYGGNSREAMYDLTASAFGEPIAETLGSAGNFVSDAITAPLRQDTGAAVQQLNAQDAYLAENIGGVARAAEAAVNQLHNDAGTAIFSNAQAVSDLAAVTDNSLQTLYQGASAKFNEVDQRMATMEQLFSQMVLAPATGISPAMPAAPAAPAVASSAAMEVTLVPRKRPSGISRAGKKGPSGIDEIFNIDP
jgi:hypothetical protein